MRVRRSLFVCAWTLLLRAGVGAVSVLQLPVDFENEHTVTVDNTIEYILQFTPTSEQAAWPARMWMSANATDTARPVLLTARQATGAHTWQLPYQQQEGAEPLYEMQRSLCSRGPLNYGVWNNQYGELSWNDICTRCFAGRHVTIKDYLQHLRTKWRAHTKSAGVMTEAFSVHVSSASDERVRVSVRVDPARDWRLRFEAEELVYITQTAARVHYYSFSEEQQSVRLVVASEEDTCAIVAIHNYTCPVAESVEAVANAGGYQMTVQRSGGAHIARSQFPLGFYVVAILLPTDEACTGPPADHSDWLYEAVVDVAPTIPPAPAATDPPVREKTFTITVRASLSRSQYVVASALTLLLFLGFYAGFGALVAAQRLPCGRRLLGPRAARPHSGVNDTIEESISPERRRRRDSGATFDSEDDNSESDEEAPPPAPPNGSAPAPVTAPVTNTDTSTQQQAHNAQVPAGAPFDLPARLTVAALCRRGERTLRARSDRYLTTLYTVAVFYALPVLQLVAAFQILLNMSGSLDVCYYNFLCAHPVGALSDFNHVLSNLGYLLLGALFMLQVRRRRQARRRAPRHKDYGIPAHYGLLSSLGAGMMMVALLSAGYHVCPNQLNFQFDTAFMYVLAVLSMVKIYQARHADINARAHITFGVLAVLIAFVVWGVLGGGAFFWGLFTVLHVFTVMLLSLRIYYVGQFRLDGASLGVAARGLREWPGWRPLYASRLIALWLANLINWAFAIYGLVAMSTDFASHLLFVVLGNTLLYLVFYLVMKLVHGERLRWYAWAHLAGAAACWAPAMFFFVSGSSSWSATPAQSRHLNHECRVLQFYDSHDLWHLLSAAALYLTFNVMLTWDDGLSAVKRTQIPVF